MKNIKYIESLTKKDINSLEVLKYNDILCTIDFKDILVKKPWGSEYLLFENKYCAVWVLNIKYMQNTSMHCHVKKDTSLVCLDGEVLCNTLNETNELDPLDGLYFSKKLFHQTQSVVEEGSYVLEIETPVNKFDLARMNDKYGRQGKEYEQKECYENVKKLTLTFPNNLIKQINKTQVEIKKIKTLEEIKKYERSSIISFLDNHKECGKIFRLIDIKNIEKESTVLIISRRK
ncbi:MAG: hypothetical protein C0625_09530 [Arcobacter sp.]|nr:MAG: hypothetical protein C0625_09530 [Arcobacter sp.]